MKRIAPFLIGFLAIAVSATDYLAHKDAEPDMAGLSLLFFGLFGLLASLGAFSWSTARIRTVPHLLPTLGTGAMCAALFYGSLSLGPMGLGFAPALGLSFVSAPLVAWALPLVAHARA